MRARMDWLGRHEAPAASTHSDATLGPGSGRESKLTPRGLAVRYAVGSLLTAAFMALLVWGLTVRVCHDLRQDGRRKVAGLAATIAAAIPAEEHQTLWIRGDEGSAEYMRLRGQLLSIRQANLDVHNIYTLVPGKGDQEWHFVLDAGSDPTALRHIGDRLPAADVPDMKRAFLDSAADTGPTREPWGNRISAYAPLRDRTGEAIAVIRIDVNADAVLQHEREFGQQAGGTAFLLALLIGFVGRERYVRRRSELDRGRNLEARLALYRVADLLARARTEEELAYQALDAIAEGTGIAHWALFRRDRDEGLLHLFATRALPEAARPELEPDAVGPDSESPVSRAAWHAEPIVVRDPADMPPYRFASTTKGLGVKPAVVALPLGDGRETIAVVQGFIPTGRAFGAEELALCRWMTSQIAIGLRRLQLERRDQLLASYMMSSGEIVVGLDPAGAITYVNPAGERAIGLPLGEVIGRSIDQFFAKTETADGTSLLDAIRPSGSYNGAIWCLRADGTRFAAEITVSPAIDRDGNQTALVLVGRDVTERHERDAELRSRSEQLLLVNEQLQQANAKLEEGNRMKNEFLASTSHELRTPLNAVIGFATLLQQDMHATPEEARTFARSIRESAEHLLGVINDILDLAKVEAGRIEVSMEVGDVNPIIHATVDLFRQTALRKGLTLRIDVPEEPLPMRLDEARMRQVLLNLLGNAIKFTDKGEVRVRALREPGPAEVRIVIEDTGIGIEAAHLPKLFTKFTQVDGSYKRRHQGTGLGLAITQSLVEKMGGRIVIESEGLGMGTRLTLAFPAPPSGGKAVRPNAAQDETMIPAGRAGAPRGRN